MLDQARFLSLQKLIREIPDFPKKGILFRDIFPLLQGPEFSILLDGIVAQLNRDNYDAVAGVESRGFILAAALAAKMKLGFVPIRKKGKLPPPVVHEAYKLEYGEDAVEVPLGHSRLLVVDDVLATGGTLTASNRALEAAGWRVVDNLVLINLKSLNQWTHHGREPLVVFSYN